MDTPESRRYARAAWSYSLLEQVELAEQTGIHLERLRAILARQGRGTPTLEELYAIAEVAGVPRWFMDGGFDNRPTYYALIEELRAELLGLLDQMGREQTRISRELLDVSQAFADLRHGLRVQTAGGTLRTQDDRGRDA